MSQPDQLLPRIEGPVLELARTDAEAVEFQPSGWVESTIPDGVPKLVPVECVPEEQPDGSWVIRNAQGGVTARLAEGAPCFRQVRLPLAGCRLPLAAAKRSALGCPLPQQSARSSTLLEHSASRARAR